MNTRNKNIVRDEQGFTLIELSIVLVIIGLIVGGVLVGQDLIKAAEIRATVGQVEKYNAAVNTFRTKYNGIPGDILQTNALAFGLYSSGATTTGLGDGNGLLTDTQGTNGNTPVGETIMFWRHLSDGSLIDGSYGSDLSSGQAQQNVASVYLPAAKLGRGNYIMAGSDSGTNYWVIGGVSTFTHGAGGTAAYAFSKALTPIESYNIDIKVDDGLPNTGIVQGRGTAAGSGGPFAALTSTNAAAWSSASTPASGDCTTTGANSTDTADTYNRSAAAGGSTQACLLRYRFN